MSIKPRIKFHCFLPPSKILKSLNFAVCRILQISPLCKVQPPSLRGWGWGVDYATIKPNFDNEPINESIKTSSVELYCAKGHDPSILNDHLPWRSTPYRASSWHASQDFQRSWFRAFIQRALSVEVNQFPHLDLVLTCALLASLLISKLSTNEELVSARKGAK